MRFAAPLFVFLAVAAFQSAFSASLKSAEKEEGAAQKDGLTELQKIDLMEFEAAQKTEAAHKNVTEEQSDETRYLEAAQEGSVEEQTEAGGDSTAQGGRNSDAPEESESSEEADGRQRRDHHEAKAEKERTVGDFTQDSTKEQDVLE